MNKYVCLGAKIDSLGLLNLLVLELKRPVYLITPGKKPKLLPFGFIYSMSLNTINNLVKQGLLYRAEENKAYKIT